MFLKGGFAMRQYLPKLMPIIVEALLDGASVTKREVAVASLGQVVQSTRYLTCLLMMLYADFSESTFRNCITYALEMKLFDSFLLHPSLMLTDFVFTLYELQLVAFESNLTIVYYHLFSLQKVTHCCLVIFFECFNYLKKKKSALTT